MNKNSVPKRRIRISETAIVLIIIFILLFTWPYLLYLYVNIPEFCHEGTERYTKEKCLDCRSGEKFYDIVAKHGLDQAGEIVGFAHQYDTFLHSNCYKDIYVLDVQCTDEFERFESYVQSYMTDTGQQSIVNLKGSFYLVLVDRPSSSEYVILAVNDTDKIIRCLYIAGFSPTGPTTILSLMDYELGFVEW